MPKIPPVPAIPRHLRGIARRDAIDRARAEIERLLLEALPKVPTVPSLPKVPK